jgi:hypothetical protein
MTRPSTVIAAGAFALALFVPAALPQQYLQDTSLGDAARKQREIHKQQPRAEKRYTNQDVITAPPTANDREGVAPVCEIVEEEPAPAASESAAPEKTQTHPARSVMDRVPETDSAASEKTQAQPARTVLDGLPYPPIIVPAGTSITVQDDQVVVPVRVSFFTPIPAGSKVRFVHYGNLSCNDYFGYCGYPIVELASLTIEGTTYPVETGAGVVVTAHRWATFTLLKPLTIKR